MVKMIALLFLFIIKYILSADELPKNGTFVLTEYQDSSCTIVKSVYGYIPEYSRWNIPSSTNASKIISPKSYDNSTRKLTYVECSSVETCNTSESSKIADDSCGVDSFFGSNSYSLGFISLSNLSVFTFTGYSDGGCNNINGKTFANSLYNYCWKLEGNGSMSFKDLEGRKLIMRVFTSNDCTGKFEPKDVKCNEKCIDNPLDNGEKIHYTCKYTSTGRLFVSLINFLLLLIFL